MVFISQQLIRADSDSLKELKRRANDCHIRSIHNERLRLR